MGALHTTRLYRLDCLYRAYDMGSLHTTRLYRMDCLYEIWVHYTQLDCKAG